MQHFTVFLLASQCKHLFSCAKKKKKTLTKGHFHASKTFYLVATEVAHTLHTKWPKQQLKWIKIDW